MKQTIVEIVVAPSDDLLAKTQGRGALSPSDFGSACRAVGWGALWEWRKVLKVPSPQVTTIKVPRSSIRRYDLKIIGFMTLEL